MNRMFRAEKPIRSWITGKCFVSSMVCFDESQLYDFGALDWADRSITLNFKVRMVFRSVFTIRLIFNGLGFRISHNIVLTH